MSTDGIKFLNRCSSVHIGGDTPFAGCDTYLLAGSMIVS